VPGLHHGQQSGLARLSRTVEDHHGKEREEVLHDAAAGRGRSALSSVFSLFKYAASTSCGQLDRHFTEPSTDISQALEPTIGSGVAGRSTRLRDRAGPSGKPPTLHAVRFFYDCEFIEDGRTIDLVSIGVVDEEGREFYAVSTRVSTRTGPPVGPSERAAEAPPAGQSGVDEPGPAAPGAAELRQPERRERGAVGLVRGVRPRGAGPAVGSCPICLASCPDSPVTCGNAGTTWAGRAAAAPVGRPTTRWPTPGTPGPVGRPWRRTAAPCSAVQ